jgi:hypothetical protein
MAAVNIAIGPASGARHLSGTRNTRRATIGIIAKIQCRRSTGTCADDMCHSSGIVRLLRRPTSFDLRLDC